MTTTPSADPVTSSVPDLTALSVGPRLDSDDAFATEDIPRGQARWTPRAWAAIVDLAIVLIPLAIGWSVVDSLREANGGGQADRFVFGSIALAVTAGVASWNVGFREGREGGTSGRTQGDRKDRAPANDGPRSSSGTA